MNKGLRLKARDVIWDKIWNNVLTQTYRFPSFITNLGYRKIYDKLFKSIKDNVGFKIKFRKD